MRKVIIFLVLILFSCKNEIPDVYDPFNDPRNISRNSGWSCGSSVAVDPEGNIHIAWSDEEKRFPWHYWIFYRFKSKDGVWSKIDTVSDTLYFADIVWIGCDSKGIIHLVYDQLVEDSSHLAVLYRMKIDKVWTIPETLSTRGMSGHNPKMFVDENDNIYVIYWDSNTMAPMKLRRKINGVWMEAVPITGSEQYTNFRFFVEDGKIHLVMDGLRLGYFYSEDGINWRLEKIPYKYGAMIPTVVTGFGKVYVVWPASEGGSIQGLFMSVRDSNGVWSEPEQIPIARGSGYVPYNPRFGKFNGEIYLIWMENTEYGGDEDIFISRMKGDREWDKKVNLTNTPYPSTASSFIVRNNKVYITWWDVFHFWDECDIFFDEVEY